MVIDWPTVWTMLFGGALTLLGTIGAEAIRTWFKEQGTKKKLVRRLLVGLVEIRHTAQTYRDKPDIERIVPALMQDIIRQCDLVQGMLGDFHLLKDIPLEAELEQWFGQARVTASMAMYNEEAAERYALFVGGHPTADAEALKMTLNEGVRVRRASIGHLSSLVDRASKLLEQMKPHDK